MKYKGIKLLEGEERESELLVEVEIKKEFDNMEELETFMDDTEERITHSFKDYPEDVYVEYVYDNLLQVRCGDITFDTKGVVLLTQIYNQIKELGLKDVVINIGVHVDSEEWFKREDGSEYNEDIVTLEEFLENIDFE